MMTFVLWAGGVWLCLLILAGSGLALIWARDTIRRLGASARKNAAASRAAASVDYGSEEIRQ